jgi:hypothetical protein
LPLTPEQRREYGARGGRTRAKNLSPEHRRVSASNAHLHSIVAQIVDKAPQLTAAQRAKIQAALASVPAPASPEAVGQ